MIRLHTISGAGSKEPACFLVETGGRRILLDLGEGPDAGTVVDVSGVGQVDALILSHGHGDHCGGLDRLPLVGNPPVWATRPLSPRLPHDLDLRDLPLGDAEVCGIPVRTGRAGHCPDGVWVRVGGAGGVLYMGDHTRESAVFARDPPPEARIVVVDASYGGDDAPQAERIAALDRILDRGPTLLPVPAMGRGVEIALRCARTGRPFRICPRMRAAMRMMAAEAEAWLRPGIGPELAELAGRAPGLEDMARPDGALLAFDPVCAEGAAAELAARFADDRRLAIVFTGYVPRRTPAEALVASGRASVAFWNVHARLSENRDIARATGADWVLPAFAPPEARSALAAALAPARIADGPVSA